MEPIGPPLTVPPMEADGEPLTSTSGAVHPREEEDWDWDEDWDEGWDEGVVGEEWEEVDMEAM